MAIPAAMRSLGIDTRMLGASGIGRYLEALLPRVLPALAPTPVTVLGDRARLEAEPWAALPHVRVESCRTRVYGPLEQPVLSLRAAAFDAFWSPHVNVPAFGRGRLVVTVHDTYHLRPEASVRLDKRLYLTAMYRAVARRADAILCVSEFTAEEVVTRLGVPRHRLVVVPNGVDRADFAPTSMHGAEPHPLGRPYLLFVGNDKPHKNLPRLVEAFAAVAERIPHDLVVVGRCPSVAPGPRVHAAGVVDEATLRRLYRGAAALVMPSLYEGFGLPPLEAMASSIPVLAARAGALPEVCGDAALYVDPLRVDDLAAGLARICEDEPLRQRLLAAGAARLGRFEWDEAARTIAGVLAEGPGYSRRRAAIGSSRAAR